MTGQFDLLLARLRTTAIRLAAAHVRQRAVPADRRWRRPDLLWPLFTKG